MQAEHVAFAIVNKRNESILADREFWLMDPAAELDDASLLDGAISTTEVNQRAVATRRYALHFHQSARAAHAILLHWKTPQFEIGGIQPFQFDFEDGLVEFLRTIHVLHIDFEPANGVIGHRVLLREQNTSSSLRQRHRDASSNSTP